MKLPEVILGIWAAMQLKCSAKAKILLELSKMTTSCCIHGEPRPCTAAPIDRASNCMRSAFRLEIIC